MFGARRLFPGDGRSGVRKRSFPGKSVVAPTISGEKCGRPDHLRGSPATGSAEEAPRTAPEGGAVSPPLPPDEHRLLLVDEVGGGVAVVLGVPHRPLQLTLLGQRVGEGGGRPERDRLL